jgi:hypothetical protein
MENIWNGLTDAERRELLSPSYVFDLLMYPHMLDKIIARSWDALHVNDQTIIAVQMQANRRLVSNDLQAKIDSLTASTVYTEHMTEADAKEIIVRLRAGQTVQVADEKGQLFDIAALPLRPRTTKTFFIRRSDETKAKQASLSANELIVWIMSFALPSASYDPCADDNFDNSPESIAYRQALIERLRVYETEWKKRPANELEHMSHNYCLNASGLTAQGLTSARFYSGRYATERPGMIKRRDDTAPMIES